MKDPSSIIATFAHDTGHSKGAPDCIRAIDAPVIPQNPSSAESQLAERTVAMI